MSLLTRRTLLASVLASASLPTLALARPSTQARLLLVLLRGGVDGLSLVPAHGDRDHRAARGSMAPDPAEVVDLDGFFGLHGALRPLLPLWKDGDLAAVHAVALAGGGRSHFDAQDVLDNGTNTAQGARSGWLNRAIAHLDPGFGPPMALSRQVPLVLRGPHTIRAADPLRTVETEPAFLDAVADMYAADPALDQALKTGLDTREMLARHQKGRPGRRTLSEKSGRVLGGLLAAEDGPRIGVLEVGGWDTHVRQEAGLNRRFAELAGGLLGVKEGLGPVWRQTLIVAVSEFGRAVTGNGTGGTDHGTGGAILLAGGAVNGGRVHADWPGLSARDRFEGRDLRATLDTRAVFKSVLADHLGLDPDRVERDVFPQTAQVAALSGLIG